MHLGQTRLAGIGFSERYLFQQLFNLCDYYTRQTDIPLPRYGTFEQYLVCSQPASELLASLTQAKNELSRNTRTFTSAINVKS
jgi:hypothetical protein